MIKAILLDLDNTLIRNLDRQFASRYLALLEAHLRDAIGYMEGKASLRRAMSRLKDSRDMVRSNAEIIIAQLVEDTDCDHAVIEAVLTSFYEQHYLQLASLIQPVEGAAQLLARLLDTDYAVVLATNPLYPPSALSQRLAWGGLDVDLSRFAFVSHSENMHSIKPDPAYYAEIVARVGIEPDQAIMVGDSEINDIAAAKSVGLSTFLVSDSVHSAQAHYQGTLAEFEQIVLRQEAIRFDALQPGMIAAQYRGNIGALWGLLRDVQPHFWNQRPDPREWSILQILCHISERERTHHLPTLKRILAEDNPFVVSPAPPGPSLPICAADGYLIAREFTAARRETLAFIQTLTAESWQRPARHSIFGLTNLLEMAYFFAQHDRLHLNQLCQTLGKCA